MHGTMSLKNEGMIMEQGRMLTEKIKLGGEKPISGPVIHHNFHKDRTGIEFRLPRWEVEK